MSRLSIAQRRIIYNKRSLACHPDRQPKEKKDEATRAQTLLNLAREQLIDDEEAAIRYLQTGVPTEAHSCAELKQAAQLIENFTRHDTPTSTTGEASSPPCTPKKEGNLAPGNPLRWLAKKPIRSREHISPSNTPRIGPAKCRPEVAQVVHLTDSSDSDDEVQVVGWVPPVYTQANQACKRPYASPEGPARRPAKKAKARVFTPTGFQLEGVNILYSKSRELGSSYLVQWVAKPHITSWLREEEVAAHFPQACRRYLADLACTSPKRLAHLARGAGPITKLL